MTGVQLAVICDRQKLAQASNDLGVVANVKVSAV